MSVRVRDFSIIVAVDSKLGIGSNNSMPWKIPQDIKRFKLLTSTSVKGIKNAVIMGRKTYESIPKNYRPLPDRINAVLTRSQDLKLEDGVLIFHDLESALASLSSDKDVGRIFVIGGAQVYKEAIQHQECKTLYLTHIHRTFEECDAFFPSYQDSFKEVKNMTITVKELYYKEDVTVDFKEFERRTRE